MNILPKKRWHVRTRESIARVRKDEAEAAEKERQEKVRTENADREARLSMLKHKSKQRLQNANIDIESKQPTVSSEPQHINLFSNFEDAVQTTNKEHDEEVKDKKEEYEKKIGYLTYLGQDTNEALKKKNWYEVLPEASRFQRSSVIKDTYEKLVLKDDDGKPKTKDLDEKNGEIAWRSKQKHDPINLFKSYCHSIKSTQKTEHKEKKNSKVIHRNYEQSKIHRSKHKKKKNKEDKAEKDKKLQKLREARLKREQQERLRTQQFLSGQHTSTVSAVDQEKPACKVKAKYNSQFNPELARQNYR